MRWAHARDKLVTTPHRACAYAMVKVLPTTFSLFESQNIINSSSEPLCISCSDDNVFIACEGCVLEVYTLPTRKLIAKFRTIWPVSEIVYNKHADCIVTLEVRGPESGTTSRVYFKWRGIGDFDRPHRVILMGSSLSQQEPVDAEIVELPVENCSCLAVCELTGVIAVGSERTIRLFALVQETTASLSTGGYKLGSVLDIRTDMKLRKVQVCGNYIACISTHRIRVLKFFIIGSSNHPWSCFQSRAGDSLHDSRRHNGDCETDDSFLLWSPSYVWKAEAETNAKANAEYSSSSMTESTSSDSCSPLIVNAKEVPIPQRPLTCQNPLSDHKSNFSTITLPAITRAISEARRDSGKHELEILGPVEYIWGQPLTTETQDDLGMNVKCRALTMLYRRFASTGYAYVHVSNESSLSRAMPAHDSLKQRSISASGGLGTKHRGGIHSIQLVPTMAVSGILHVDYRCVNCILFFVQEGGTKHLIGMSCVLANRAKGYVYDVFDKSGLITTVSFMSRLAWLPMSQL